MPGQTAFPLGNGGLVMRGFGVPAALVACALLAGCAENKDQGAKGKGSPGNSSAVVRIRATGSSFVERMMKKWSSSFETQGARVDYQATGSGKGVQDMLSGETDFGCTDAPLSADQVAKAGGADKVVQVPLVMGAVVVVYNIPDLKNTLKLDGPTIAGIYMGAIKNWSDPAIAKLNEGAVLPDKPISVCQRADGSGTSHIFTSFLSAVSPEWKSKVGASTQPAWPVGQGGQKNAGVASLVEQTPGAIGYVELSFALEKKNLKSATIQNAAGKFIEPTLDAVTAAAGALKEIPDDLVVNLTNLPGDASYPICGTVWAVFKKDLKADKMAAVVKAFTWALSDDGQKAAPAENYARLPDAIAGKARTILAALGK